MRPRRRVRAGEETDRRLPRQAEEKGRGGHIKFGGCGRRPKGPGTGNRSEARAAAASGFSVRPASAPAAAAAGGGRRGRGRAPEPASAGARPAPPPPRGLRGNAQPIPAAHCGLAPAPAAPLRPLRLAQPGRRPPSSLPHSALSPPPPTHTHPRHSLLRDKFLNFDELFQRTFLKGAAWVWVELEVPRRRVASPAGAAVLPLPCPDVGL